MIFFVDSLNLVFISVTNFAEIYLLLIFLKLSLAWFPNVNWYNEPFSTLSRLTDPYLRLFSGTIPVVLGMDMSPMLGILFLQCLMVIFSHIKIANL
nr:Ycf19 [Porphyropsis coccinea]